MQINKSNTFNSLFASAATDSNVRQKNTVLRNTFIALALCMLVATGAAVFSIATGFYLPYALVFIAIIALSFIIQMTADKPIGLVLLFVFAGLLGLNLGPILSFYLQANLGYVIVQAFALTASAFFGLSAYAIVTKKDFSFLSGIITVLALVAMVGIIFSLFIKPHLYFSLIISGLFAIFSALIILFEVSRVVNGGETNYIRATLSIFLAVYNLFVSLLSILGNNRN